MKIIQLPNPKLRQKSETVILPLSQSDEKIINMMIEHIDESQKENSKNRAGIGIAAIQMGFLKRMFYINVPESEINPHFRDFLINPKIESESMFEAALSNGEGCLSINEKDDESGLVHRKFKVKVSGYSYFKKEWVTYTKTGLLSIVFQHEMDHLNGNLYIDWIDKKNPWIQHKDEQLI